jgi:hypothetical protein
MRLKKILTILVATILTVFASNYAAQAATATTKDSAAYKAIEQRWTRSQTMHDEEDKISSYFTVTAIYYSAEYIEAYVQDQAQKNLWTQAEMEDYKYKFLGALQLDKMIPIFIKIENYGPSMYLGPFDNIAKLRIDGEVYKASDYDKRFNFKLQGTREGLIFFPRFDPKTGKDLLKGAKNVTLELASFMSSIAKTDVRLMWTVTNDNPMSLYKGKTADKLEQDRLLLRLEKLKKDKADQDAKAKTVDDEMSTIQKRLDDLSKKQ